MKRKIIAVLLGVFIIIVGTIIVSYISFLYLMDITKSLGLSEFKSIINSAPYIYIVLIIKAADILIIVLGGFIAGWFAKEKGWLYGGLSGFIYFLLFFSISIIAALSLPNNFKIDTYLKALPGGLIPILEASIGGLISEGSFKFKQYKPKPA